jgi:hypothetical protein
MIHYAFIEWLVVEIPHNQHVFVPPLIEFCNTLIGLKIILHALQLISLILWNAIDDPTTALSSCYSKWPVLRSWSVVYNHI